MRKRRILFQQNNDVFVRSVMSFRYPRHGLEDVLASTENSHSFVQQRRETPCRKQVSAAGAHILLALAKSHFAHMVHLFFRYDKVVYFVKLLWLHATCNRLTASRMMKIPIEVEACCGAME